ncbi:sensor histidine kinase [Ramlibacter algicola]|uniref:histidine kinase n=1 Tax=Ramlibacter algicola TaxID=2795217 RepID=A0A934Q629_9BURK|nr:ATP-binding protein [Ramlibacter algicola]MBK0394857.1 ATP-binding protein [Ramlibacter algicola]
MRRRFGLVTRLSLRFAGLVVSSTVIALGLARWLGPTWQAGLLTLAILVPVALAFARTQLQPLLAMLRALSGTVISYRDGDFSHGLHWERDDEIGDLVKAHNDLGRVLREQRQGLAERELLLDTMVQNTPVAMLLVGHAGNVVFGNLAARQLLHGGRRIEGQDLDRLLLRAFGSLREAYARGGDGLFTVQPAKGSDAEDEIYHLARRQFTLNGQRHELLLLRHLTAELRRQEVQTWKKVIRVLSHELNNSLAPAASLARSGAELLRRGQPERLPEIFRTIEERTSHLQGFIEGYARFAKLPTPRLEDVAWDTLVGSLQAQVPFQLVGALPAEPVRADAGQVEQALLNLLKNAHESGSPPSDIALAVRRAGDALAIDVMDRGSGMTEVVMSQALVPFYSTKRSGTGLGLALAREIAEAHGGRIVLANRDGGGLVVSLVLPA